MHEDAWDLRGFEGAIRRQWRVVALAVAAGLALASAALLVMPVSYSATALLYFDPSPRGVLEDGRPGAGDGARVDSAVDLIASEPVLASAARALGLAGERAPDWLGSRVKVQREGPTYLVSVRANAPSPMEAAAYANAVANSFIHEEVAAKIDGVLADVAALRAQVTVAGEAVRAAQQALALRSGFEERQTLASAQSHYRMLLDRLTRLEAEAFLQVPSARIAAAASPPVTPSSPKVGLTLALAGGLALIFGLLLAFARERVTPGFVDAEEAGRRLGLEPILTIPRQKLQRGRDGELWFTPADQLAQAPLAEFPEAVRRLRISVDQALQRKSVAHRGAVVMVSSATGGEGKTTLALALARSYGLAGHSVLLIDCDLRNPSIHRYLGLEPSRGLLEYLAEPAEPRQLKAMMAEDDVSGVRIALGGLGAQDATDELVAGSEFARLIAAAVQSFEFVIIDSPPLGSVVDGLHLARLADVVTFVMRYRSVPRNAAAQALAALARTRREQSELVGVLNLGPAPIGSKAYRAATYMPKLSPSLRQASHWH